MTDNTYLILLIIILGILFIPMIIMEIERILNDR